MTEPTKRNLIKCLEQLSRPPGWRPVGWDKEISAIRKLIEVLPNPVNTDEKPVPTMTDEEAVKILEERGKVNKIMKHASENNEHGPTYWDEKDDAALAHLRARLAQKPKVTREQARGLVIALETFCRESGIPTDRVKELNVPQVFLDILGLEVEEEK